jgi:rhodanese-related sulfurtransferase
LAPKTVESRSRSIGRGRSSNRVRPSLSSAAGRVGSHRRRGQGRSAGLSRELGRRFEESPRDLDIIAYCTRPDEATGAGVALFLRDNGYQLRDNGYQALALTGGYRAWREAGHPIESKAAEMARTRGGVSGVRPTMERPHPRRLST